MKPIMNSLAHKILGALNLVAVRRGQTYGSDRAATMRRREIDLVIDVGANAGQYARELRDGGYPGAILSLEPLPDPYAALKRTMARDERWNGLNAAAGTVKSRATFNVSADSVCSSFLEPSETLLSAIPTARIIDHIEVDIVRIDEITLPHHTRKALKLDVQGFEKEALAGARRIIESIDVLELELSLKQSYLSGYGITEALPHLYELGFTVTSIGRGATDCNTGQLIDVDVLLERGS